MDVNKSKKTERISPKEISKLSFELLKDYFKQFAGTQIIAVVSTILVWMITLFLSGSLISLLFAESFYALSITLQDVISIFLFIPGFFVFFSFIGSGFGMASEILTGGDYYVKLKSSFYYFKKHWLGYSGLAIINIIILILVDSIFPKDIYPLDKIFQFILLLIIEASIKILIFSLIGFVPVALSQGNSFFLSFKNAWLVFKGNWYVIIKSMALILVPVQVFSFMYGYVLSFFIKSNFWWEVYFISWIFLFIGLFFIYFPLIFIHLTVLYQHFSTVTQNTDVVK